jgi:sporulation protein YlmC with PRC-barrel domain
MSPRRFPELAAQHQLLDRQILDSDGRMVGKVDDVELEEQPDGRLAVAALLTGPGALGPRLGGALGALTSRGWSRLSGHAPDDSNRVDYSVVDAIETAVRLNVSRATVDVDGFEQWVRTRIIDALPGAGVEPQESAGARHLPGATSAQAPASPAPTHRLDHLLGMHVRFADGTDGDQVTDVRLVPGDRLRGLRNELVTEGLIVGRRRPGTLFGYDRNPRQGPWLVRVAIRFLHRRTGYVEWADVASIDWRSRTVHLSRTDLRDLQPRADHP